MTKLLALLILVLAVSGCSFIHDVFNPLPPDHPDWQSGGGSVSPF